METTKTNPYVVQSELFQEMNEDRGLGDTPDVKNVRSTFSFKCLPESCPRQCHVDEDGDLVVCRSPLAKGITIEHVNRTSLDMVGMQVWRSALLMGDFILDNNRNIFTRDQVVLELGSGVGLTGIIAAMCCKEIVFTDVNNKDMLSMIEKNIHLNRDLIVSHTTVMPLDFSEPELQDALWKKIRDANIIIAADVIYDNDITKQFVNTLRKLMAISPRKTAYVGMEKRYVFSAVDLEVCAPCYEYFKELLTDNNDWCRIELLDCDFPQYFRYNKVKELVIFKLTANQ